MALPSDDISEAAGSSADDTVAARDCALVERVRGGDTAALEAMFRAYAEPLYGYAMSYLHSRESAEEIVHDLFLRIWSQRDTLEMPRALKSYLFQATRNRAVSYLRHARVEQRFRERITATADASVLYPRQASADEEVRTQALGDAIDKAIEALPPRCREVFVLSREQQLTYAEIADVLRISVKTVEIHMGRALSMLRAALAFWNG